MQLGDVRQSGAPERMLQLRSLNSVVANEKCDVLQILRVISTHHFGQDEIERRGPKQLQMAQQRASDRN